MNVLIACAEYIEREAVNALIKAECSPKVAAYLIDAVAAIPAADVVERKYDGPSDVYTPDGKLVMKDATPEQVREFESGLYIFQRKKILVK